MDNIAEMDVLERARAWIAGDPDSTTRAELHALVESGRLAELADRMDGTLTFGTAGIRGEVGAGSNRMNRASVIRTTKGLADYLLEKYGGTPPGPVVVGRDARITSHRFMLDTVGVLAAAGLPVRYWPGEVPTPFVPFALRELEGCAGVMITASHNPPQDNGYKVYDANGAQIIPPADSAIASAIDRVGPASAIERVRDVLDGRRSGVDSIEPGTLHDYRIEVLRGRYLTGRPPLLRIVYSPMHGVGWRQVRALLLSAGHEDLHPVPEQMEPDGRFPTVAFPNPEEPGAMDLSLGLADRIGADLVLANDPDADRLAVAAPGPEGWVLLTGNQTGVLLADYILSHQRDPSTSLVISSIVSTPMTAQVAAAYGARFETTLTGFKWIANAALDIEQATDARFRFGFEEALGYTVGSAVRDKDGVSAAVYVADLAADCHRQGATLLDRLAQLYRRFGLWISIQRSIRKPGVAGMKAIGTAMRSLGEDPPEFLGGLAVSSVTDYRRGAEARPRWLGRASLIELHLEGGNRVLVRPSGTEPKLKIYVDAHIPVPKGYDPFAMEAALVREATGLADELVRSLDV